MIHTLGLSEGRLNEVGLIEEVVNRNSDYKVIRGSSFPAIRP